MSTIHANLYTSARLQDVSDFGNTQSSSIEKDYSKYHFFQNNSQIEIVERYKYLGIVFYFNGNLKHAVDDLYNKALKAFFSVKSKFNNFQEVPLKTCLNSLIVYLNLF